MSRRITAFALLAALASASLLAGCSSSEPVVLAPPPPLPPPPQPTQINVFGEVDGRPRPGPKSVLSTALRQHTFVAEGADADVSLDPSGKWMVFTSTRHSVHPKIYLQRVDGVTVTQLTTDEADDAHPTFSPDGRKIAFASNRTGRWSLYVMDTAGTNTVQITNSQTHDLHPSFSPDGTQLVYSSLGARSDQWELWVIDLATSSRKMIGEGLFPVWSPDKNTSRIAFQRARQRGSRHFSLWTLDLDNGEPRRMTEVAMSPNAAIVTPTWSPDGQWLAFATLVEVPTAQPLNVAGSKSVPHTGGPISAGPSDGVNPPSAAPSALSAMPAVGFPAQVPASSPETRVQFDLWVVAADGTNRRRLTDGVGVSLSPTFAPDGRVYFISDRGGAEAVWSVIPTATNEPPVANRNNAPARLQDPPQTTLLPSDPNTAPPSPSPTAATNTP